jgi:hypothetical protein
MGRAGSSGLRTGSRAWRPARVNQRGIRSLKKILELIAGTQLAKSDADPPTARPAREVRPDDRATLPSASPVDAADSECELVPPEANDRLVGADIRADRRHEISQDVVPGQMTVGVVDPLEPVHVNDREHQRTVRTMGALDLGTQQVLPEPAAESAGEVVEMRAAQGRHGAGSPLGRAPPVYRRPPSVVLGAGAIGSGQRAMDPDLIEKTLQRRAILRHRVHHRRDLLVARLGCPVALRSRDVAALCLLVQPGGLAGVILRSAHTRQRERFGFRCTRRAPGSLACMTGTRWSPMDLGRSFSSQTRFS